MQSVAAFALIALAVAASGCRASASASLNTGAKTEVEEPVEPVSESRSGAPPAAAEVALFGARHDLGLSADRKNPTCNCVAIALGQPNDPGMKWEGPAPSIDPGTQLVLALSSEGVTCAEPPKEGLGASYWGYRESGDDVIVVLEVARLGRPVTTGAIIPKPVGSGQVRVQPASKAVPYGRPLSASETSCPLGNPGGPRAATRSVQQEDDAVTDQVIDNP
jgi:hypothetical protein